ncbi:PREDICTED: protein transport protein Sec31A isoform X2 [Nicrophorus vespilloides]|uniref:Protein transport protein Sec31A isoform X2 n=1 Tax=Nicrophorus vespilloides TaxID=110193 RepID=A0ABM1MSF6_NICVS|nr:PREDICTED: protein transport protein Sec31A isoform X2 [Nicrophorus vespilloides]
MKVKDLERTANIAWSPANQDSIYLAAGTAANQLDATFNTNASLEIFSLNLSEPGMEMDLKVSIPTEQRFHKLVWGPYGGDGKGCIVGGCDGGLMQIYNVDSIFKNESALISTHNKHSGPVHSLDFNSFQNNLLASGASESEIYIWDMNNTNAPMTPGAKSQPFEDVLSIQWNKQVQHILASTFSSKCVVWDLRKNEPIIKLTDTVSRIRWKVVAWHPEVATQLCLASEEDQAPIIQLWDLRFATSPLKTLENHQRGILSMAWCTQDPDLLISCAKDNRIVCWNPNSNYPGGEILSEVAKTNQWNFDITWCPKNPALIATPGFDGHVSVYSLMGGKAQQIQTTNKIADSFPGMEGYAQAPVAQQNVAPVSVDLSKPPKWLKKPVGASFGFGGKLFTFENDKEAITQAKQNMQPGDAAPYIPQIVYVSQVITESDLVNKSTELEQALEYGNFTEYCKNKADSTDDQHKKYIWHFLKANFEQNPRAELLNLLGYKIEDVNAKLNEFVDNQTNNDVDGLIYPFASNRIDDVKSSPFDSISQEVKKPIVPYKIKTGDDTEGLIAQALLLNNVEAAVELCIQSKRFADALIIAMTGGSELLARTQYKYLQQCEGYVSSLISALVSEDWISVINNCDINSWKEALAAALTHASDEELPMLCETMGSRLETESDGNPKLLEDAQLCYICAGSFEKLVSSWSSKSTTSNNDLQELVELVTFLQRSVERQGRIVDVSGKLAELLTEYAFILASQGNLSTALNYLGSSQNERVAALRERLTVALGHKTVYGQVNQRSRQNSRHSVNYGNQFANPPASFKNQFSTGLPNVPTPVTQPWQQPQLSNTFNQQPPKPFSPAPVAPPTTQPPRPGSVGSAHGGSGLPKGKYLLDPSVQSNHYGSRNQFGPNSMMPTPMQPQIFQPGASTNPFTPNNTNVFNPAPVPAAQPFTPNPGQFNTNATTNSSFPPSTPFVPSNNFNQNPMMPPPDMSSAMNVLPSTAAPGWNDPPAFNKPAKQPTIKSDLPSQDPITHPIFGTAPVQNVPANGYMPPTQQHQQQPFNPYAQDNSPQMFQPPPMTTGSQQGFNRNMTNFNTQAVPANANVGTQQQEVSGRVEVPQPIAKLPIPEEHIHMQTVFNELKNQCSCAANNPQTKRKIEDVSRKLETLYDLLRDRKLSQNTLSALHQMVQCVQNGDYTGGLAMHTQLVSGQDFSQIASFMPGLKVLLQCALQLQVYLR